jgi:type IV pilus assembly protein PilO
MRKVIFFMALIGMAYLGWAYMIKPANAALSAKKIQLQKDLAKLNELQKEKANAENLSEQIQQMEQAIEFFENKLPHKSQIHQVLAQVTEIINRHNLKPKTNKTDKIKEHSGYVELPLKMELEGGFNSYYSFLLELEKLDRITKIRELTVKEEKDTPGSVNAEFTMSIFFQQANG